MKEAAVEPAVAALRVMSSGDQGCSLVAPCSARSSWPGSAVPDRSSKAALLVGRSRFGVKRPTLKPESARVLGGLVSVFSSLARPTLGAVGEDEMSNPPAGVLPVGGAATATRKSFSPLFQTCVRRELTTLPGSCACPALKAIRPRRLLAG